MNHKRRTTPTPDSHTRLTTSTPSLDLTTPTNKFYRRSRTAVGFSDEGSAGRVTEVDTDLKAVRLKDGIDARNTPSCKNHRHGKSLSQRAWRRAEIARLRT